MSVRSVTVLQGARWGALKVAQPTIATGCSWLNRAGFADCAFFEISTCGDLR
jgi:hypothetical protein